MARIFQPIGPRRNPNNGSGSSDSKNYKLPEMFNIRVESEIAGSVLLPQYHQKLMNSWGYLPAGTFPPLPVPRSASVYFSFPPERLTYELSVGGPSGTFSVDWGDGTSNLNLDASTTGPTLSHTYAAAGNYVISITIESGQPNVYLGETGAEDMTGFDDGGVQFFDSIADYSFYKAPSSLSPLVLTTSARITSYEGFFYQAAITPLPVIDTSGATNPSYLWSSTTIAEPLDSSLYDFTKAENVGDLVSYSDFTSLGDFYFPVATSCYRTFSNTAALSIGNVNAPLSTTTFQAFNFTKATTIGSLNFPLSANARQMFWNANALTTFGEGGNNSLSLPEATDCEELFNNATSLPSVKLNLPKVGSFKRGLQSCTSLTTIDPSSNISNANDITFAFTSCSSLTSFPPFDFPNAPSALETWSNCSSLTSFPLIDLSSVTTLDSTWEGCSALTSFSPIDFSSVTNSKDAWLGCSSLTSFPSVNLSNSQNFLNTWKDCSGLTTFPTLNLQSGVDIRGAWSNCSSLTTFPNLNLQSGVYFNGTWQNCSSLTSISVQNISSSAKAFTTAWSFCASLTDFPANFFDNLSGQMNENAFYNTWFGCSSLTAASVDNILISLDNSGVLPTINPASIFSKRINIQYTSVGPSYTATAAEASLNAKGWDVQINRI
jgi:hypothetical protein